MIEQDQPRQKAHEAKSGRGQVPSSSGTVPAQFSKMAQGMPSTRKAL